MKRSFILLIICFICSPTLTGQKLWETGAVKGIWSDPKESINSKDWKAQWIWLSEESPMMLSRKNFELGGQPQKAVLKITATSQYKLYINEPLSYKTWIMRDHKPEKTARDVGRF